MDNSKLSLYDYLRTEIGATWKRYGNELWVSTRGYVTGECLSIERNLSAYGVQPVQRRYIRGMTVTLYKGDLS